MKAGKNDCSAAIYLRLFCTLFENADCLSYRYLLNLNRKFVDRMLNNSSLGFDVTLRELFGGVKRSHLCLIVCIYSFTVNHGDLFQPKLVWILWLFERIFIFIRLKRPSFTVAAV